MGNTVESRFFTPAIGSRAQAPDIPDISGGSFPGVAIRNVLQMPILSVPYGNADENNHAPNENLAIECFTKGIRTSAALFFQLAGK